MAEEIIAATVRVLLQNAISFAADRIGLEVGLSKELEALQSYAKDIQAVLADAEMKRSQNPIVTRWLYKVEGVAFEADYVLDELRYESLRRQVKHKNQPKVCKFFSFFKHHVSFSLRMGSKIRDINQKLKTFNLESLEIGLIRMEDSLISDILTTSFNVKKSRQTDSLPLHFVEGRGREECKIVELLLGSSHQNVCVLPIVGMGGLGKTTLAKSVYNNPQINDHFDRKIWICVSTKFELAEIFKEILESLIGGNVDISGRDVIAQHIRNEIRGKIFFFVLDDVWNEDPKLWDDFFMSLVALNTVNGSCCLLITRLQTTANIVSTIGTFKLGQLSDDECWYLLCQRATKGHGDIPEELNVHRDQILRRCQGLPLVVGGLLSLQKREDWILIVKNKILKVSEDFEGEIMSVLKLSFDNLPCPSIKKCFAYCSIFSKDTPMDKEQLIELWMAEGFLQEDCDLRTMEEVGGNYLRILLQSSLLEELDYQYLGCYYQMHDLIHDVAESVSKLKQRDVNKYKVRHLTLEGKRKTFSAISPLIQIVKGNISNEVLFEFKYLHVLNLSGVEIYDLAHSISKLKHLHLLILSDSRIKILPDSLCKLYSLQTLRLDGCYNLQYLPQGLSNLIGLRHLQFFNKNNKFQMPPHLGRLTCLQTLMFFNVGEKRGCGIEELGSMKSHKGELDIRNLDLVKNKEVAGLAKMHEKTNLERLELSWATTIRPVIDNCDEHVLEGLEPHPNLRNLKLINFMGVQFPQWLGKMSALVRLVFFDCKKCTTLPELGHLPHLEEIEFCGLENVVRVEGSFYNVEDSREGKSFPSLKYMVVSEMMNLVEWKVVVNGGGYPKLEHLDIEYCSKLITAPTYFPRLNTLRSKGNIPIWMVKDIVGNSGNFLKTLRLHSIDNLRNLQDVIHNQLTSLVEFELCDCKALTDIPSLTLEFCKSLKSLTVQTCRNLVYFPLHLQQTSLLTSIKFYQCPKLFTTNDVPRGFIHLTNLRYLSIGPFSHDSLYMFDWEGLLATSTTLRTLQLYGSRHEHSTLPKQLKAFTSLEVLGLDGFESVEVLPDWLGNFTSLKRLELRNCCSLQCLPSMHATGRLTKLQELLIHNCPLLKESWGRKINDYDSEWSKISCLPNLIVRMI